MAKRIAKGKTSRVVCRGPPVLEADFGMKLLEKELELEKSWNIETINELVHMYTEMIEYYEYHKDPKYLDFQDRMHKMLVKPQVIASMREDNRAKNALKLDKSSSSQNTEGKARRLEDFEDLESPKSVSTETSTVNSEAELKQEEPKAQDLDELSDDQLQRSRSRHHTVSGTPSKSPTQNLNDIQKRKQDSAKMKEALSAELSKTLTDVSYKATKFFDRVIGLVQASTKETAAKAVSDFRSQDSDLSRRLSSRKQVTMNKSVISIEFMPPAENVSVSDIHFSDTEETFEQCSFLSTALNKSHINEQQENSRINDFRMVEYLENKLEELMEKNFSEKVAKMSEVRLRYESQMKELEGQGGLAQMIVGQMKVDMENEIKAIAEEFDNKRKQDVRALKQSFVE
ncbi:unnamed protein product [Blepharisma stoltei]|uniref:Uncharacterized protein n=1 Tax=Blepharisma stoltei TaxID=1481888 RepID=A0AAU9KF62_9CILI|nr:unnamed protein product [Blepharisma stoltei]